MVLIRSSLIWGGGSILDSSALSAGGCCCRWEPIIELIIQQGRDCSGRRRGVKEGAENLSFCNIAVRFFS
jgi:hypothetical protein